MKNPIMQREMVERIEAIDDDEELVEEVRGGSSRTVRLLNSAAMSPRSFLAAIITLLPTTAAHNLTAADCDYDQGIQKFGASFPFRDWLNRGICVHRGSYEQCQVNLMAVLDNLDSIHSTEYSASAGVLALLPTIGALFGTPTSEIWTLLTVIPCGGALSMVLSFGGTIMSTELGDYEKAFGKYTINIGKGPRPNDTVDDDSDDEADHESLISRTIEAETEKLALLTKRITRRIDNPKSLQLPRLVIALGMLSMVVMFCVVNVGMGIIEAGSVYSNGCTYYWWFHVWYIAVTVSTLLDNWAQSPFKSHRKLYLTGIPYDIEVTGGDVITKGTADTPSPEKVGLSLQQLKTISPGGLRVVGSILTTTHRNSVLVLVSIAHDPKSRSRWRTGFQLFTKTASITVFVFGTCVLAAVSLLAMPMVQMVSMLIVASGIGSRVVAGWISNSVESHEPMIHVITKDSTGSDRVVAEIFNLQQNHHSRFQVEIGGHIFVDGRRVAKRSLWWRRLFGVMTAPFDVRKAKDYSPRMAASLKNGSGEQFKTVDGSDGMEFSRLRTSEERL